MSSPPQPPSPTPPNRLAGETSPYLLQHAHNPVDWYPWGPEALARARREGKPILLSVGYAACHWCHVMERESFEDPATAELMNQHYVCVKVDREERPDLDEIYMAAVQAFSGGHGGWPMTVMLTPEAAPYFGGTYFPPEPRQGMPSFRQVLEHGRSLWVDRRAEVARTTADLVRYLEQAGQLPAASGLSGDWLRVLSEAAASTFDPQNGGFGERPKFPPHGTIAALLAHHHRAGERAALRMATTTLDGMLRGGMYDLAGGGFCRYSVDGTWRIPHFEKMLYDNAQLIPLYVDAWRATGRPAYARVARETCDWLLRELALPGGGFASALDADSATDSGESEEGWFYTWTPRELRDLLGVVDGTRIAALLEVTDAGTFEGGRSVLRLDPTLEVLESADRAFVSATLPRLLAAREARPRPGIDDKVITAWNALAISALARAGAALGEPRYLAASEACADFLLTSLVRDGRLLRTWRNGTAQLLGYADDYAALAVALTDLFQATGELFWLDEALGLCGELMRRFWDPDDGGLFYSGHDAEPLITRSKKMLGGAEPSANGLAAWAFARLATLCGRDDLADAADAILSRYQAVLDQAPRAIGLEAVAAAWRTGTVRELAVVVGDDDGGDALLDAAWARFQPFAVVAPVAADALDEAVARMPWLAGKGAPEGRSTAYLCEGSTCQAPAQSAAALLEQLDRLAAPPVRPVGFGRDRAPALPEAASAWLNHDGALSLDRLRGRVVVLDFFTSCCINCLHVLPELAAVEAHFAGRPVDVVGVHSAKFPMEKEPAAVARALRREGVRHPVVLDPDHELWEQYAVRGWPTVMVLDPQGRIAWRQSGEVDRGTLIGIVEDLLVESAAADLLAPDAAAARVAPEGVSGALSSPGKLCVYPPTGAQEQGADPFDGSGRLYLSDTGHHQIVEASLSLDAAGWPVATVTRRFGDGQPRLADGPAERAGFRAPQGLDRTGARLYVADTGNHAVREIDLEAGTVATVAGDGSLGRGPEGLRSPWDIAAGGPESGAARPGESVVFIAMAGAHQLSVYIPATGRLSPFVGTGQEAHVDGAPGDAALAQPSGLELFGRYLFFSDSETSSVRFLDLHARQVGTLVGQSLFDFGDVDGVGAEVRLQHPLDVAVADGRVWVADTYNHKIKSIEMGSGETRAVAGGPGALCEPGGIARAGAFLLVADTGHHRICAVRIADGALRVVTLREGSHPPDAGH